MSHILLRGWHRYKERGKYSLKSSVAIAFVATILLWWLPIFGPMVSGYVAGRTSGNKYKGLLSTAIVAGVIAGLSFLFTYVIPIPAYISYYFSGTILYNIQLISPFGAWLTSSVGLMITNFPYFVSYMPPSWVVLVAFGFIGGGMSELLMRNPEKKSVMPIKHPTHDDARALVPRQVDYEPQEKPHPLLKRIIREKDIQDAAEDYI